MASQPFQLYTNEESTRIAVRLGDRELL